MTQGFSVALPRTTYDQAARSAGSTSSSAPGGQLPLSSPDGMTGRVGSPDDDEDPPPPPPPPPGVGTKDWAQAASTVSPVTHDPGVGSAEARTKRTIAH